MAALPEHLAGHAGRAPQRLAVDDGAERLTYGELWARSRALAARLQAAGVGPGDCVVLGAARSTRSVTATVATWLAGAVHVPIDPDQPARRRQAILDRLRPRLVIGDFESDAASRWSLAELERPGAGGGEWRPEPIPEERIAYCMFTSGSGGLPKGVQISHRALRAFFEDILPFHDVGEDSRCLNTAPAFFDVTVLDTWFPLARGASVRLTSAADLFPPRLVGLLRDARVTHFCAVAPVLHLAARFGSLLEKVPLPDLRCIMTGAEQPEPEHMHAWLRAAPQARILNGYGPTEATCVCTVYVIRHGDTAARYPIGVPLRRIGLLLVDESGRPSQQRGELWISGDQVMDGYAGDPEETERRMATFEGRRHYRSGDLCERTPDGAIHFIGRADAEVKLDGYRIHLAEVQRAAEETGLVARAFATRLERSGRPCLGLAVVPVAVGGAKPELGAELISAMRQHVPPYMLPSAVVVLDDFPTLGSGKVDLVRLREIVASAA